jgi:HNH endonuclease
MHRNGICMAEACSKPATIKDLGLCLKHYWALPLLERYQRRIDRSGGPDACHPWTGPCFPSGYGHFLGDGEQRAHRFGYKRLVGPIPKGLHVLHRCDNPPCQNQGHWFLGTPADNSADKVAKGRQARNHGEKSSAAKLTWAQVREIRSKFTGNHGEKAALAREYGVSQVTLGRIVMGRIWRHE